MVQILFKVSWQSLYELTFDFFTQFAAVFLQEFQS